MNDKNDGQMTSKNLALGQENIKFIKSVVCAKAFPTVFES